MNIRRMLIRAACVTTLAWFSGVPSALSTEDVFITIGSGDITGVYFPAGLAISEQLNDKHHEYGIRSTVEATAGSTFNLNALMAGYLEFGLAQSDKQYQAYHGQAEWTTKGPQTALRSVFSLHREVLTLVAAEDSGIRNIEDLKGKRVSTGNPGSSQHQIVMDALEAVSLDPEHDMDLQKVIFSDTPTLLQDNLIDAFFFTVGHPSDTIRKALFGERKARIIPISGSAIDRLIQQKRYYSKSTIPVTRFYPGTEHQLDVATFGVVATLCTSTRISSDIVYTLTTEVFENLQWFKQQHPAFADLSKYDMLEGLSAPLHPGALRYFKKIGLIP